jgi:hypothetical protein
VVAYVLRGYMATDLPIACTLSPRDYRVRLLVTFPPAAADAVPELLAELTGAPG